MSKEDVLRELLKYRYAHRGLHHKPTVPENSLMAIGLAAEKGFGIELDVHLTRDGKLAVMHDHGLKRVTTVRSDHLAVVPENAAIPCETTVGCKGVIEDMTLAEAKSYPLEESDERVPEFREVLELIAGRVPMIIELKPVNGNQDDLCKKVMSELEGYEGLYCVESFNSFAVMSMKKLFPDIVRGQLGSDLAADYKARVTNDPREGGKFGKVANTMVKDLVMNRMTLPDFVAYKFEHKRNSTFRAYKGAKIFWTIKDPIDLAVGEGMGAACIFEGFVPESPLRGETI